MTEVDVNDLWSRLALEGKSALIKRIRRAENREPGFTTLVVRKEGFSDDDETHNLVLKYLRRIGAFVFNPGMETARLKQALRDSNYYESHV